MTTDLKDALNTRYKTFINRDSPWLFYIGLRDYINYTFNNPMFSSVIDREIAKRDHEYEILASYEKEAIWEMDATAKKLLAIIEKKKINPDDFSRQDSFLPSVRKGDSENIIEHMKMYQEGVLYIGGNQSDNINNFLFDIAANLLRMGYRKDVEEFLVSDREYWEYYQRIDGRDNELYVTKNQRGNFIFSKTWPARFEQDRKIDGLRKREIWGSWEEIIKIWHAARESFEHSSKETIFDHCLNAEKYRLYKDEAYAVINLVGDIQLFSENHQILPEQLEYFHTDELRAAVDRTHTMLMEEHIEKPINVFQTASAPVERDDDIMEIKLKDGMLAINKKTGDVTLNKVSGNLNPSSQEYNVLLKLAIGKHYQATYTELLGQTPTKISKRNLGFVIRNIKEVLGILPIKTRKNEDIFENRKNHSYKLIA